MPLDQPTTAFVWVWLPEAQEPVVAGRLDAQTNHTTFTYGRSYLDRANRIALYEPELPLRTGPQAPELMSIHGCIADAGPDAWGRRVINRRVADRDESANLDLTDLAYLLESGSDRTGGLDFQSSPDEYRPRLAQESSLDQLLRAADDVDQSRPLPPELEGALFHGTSIGGARPKAVVTDGPTRLIAKFGSSQDVLPTVKLEFVAMRLAERAGLDVAPVRLEKVLDKDVLLVERFDRPAEGTRRLTVSARTILRLGELGVGASYCDLADIIRRRFTHPERALHELFSRITFNVLVGNTDDHAKNHAAFWDGSDLTLTPAYDIVPQPRSGEEASQAMAIGRDGYRSSQLSGCIDRANDYLLGRSEAQQIVSTQIDLIQTEWVALCDEAGLAEADRDQAWGRQFLNPFALRGL